MLFLLPGFQAPAPAGAAAANGDALVQKALANLEKENFEEALEELTQSWNQGPQTPEKALYLGKVHRALLNYPKARGFLEKALSLRADYPEARILLADTLIALDQADLAREQLRPLEAAGYRPGEVALLQGQAAAKKKEYSQAEKYLRLAQQDPALAQKAKLELSQVQLAQNRPQDAKKTLTEAVSLGPQTQVGGYAQYYLGSMDQRLRESGPLRFNVSFGFDFDSNVTLQPGSPGTSVKVSGQGDIVYTHSAFLEYTPINIGPFSLRASYTYYQNFHRRIPTYDVVSHTVGLTPVYNFQSSRLWVPFYFNFTDVESDKYYTAFDLSPTYLYLLTPKVGLEIGAHFARKYYWFPLSFPQDDRSGRTLGGMWGIYYFIKNQQGFLQARISIEHDYTSGDNWENTSYHLLLGGLYPVTSRLKLGTFVEMIMQPYTHPFFNGNPSAHRYRRKDALLLCGFQAIYNIYKGLDFNVHYYFTRDDSNIALYDYHRHIVGCQLNYRY
jgi:tetratricopeptide (TPR) repeat protein